MKIRLGISLLLGFILTCTLVSLTAAQNTFETADELPLDDSVTKVLKESDSEYWWKFTTTCDGSLTLSTQADEGIDYDLCIFDSMKHELALLTNSCSEASVTLDDLSEGRYYIKVNRKEGSGDFTITTDFTPASMQNDS